MTIQEHFGCPDIEPASTSAPVPTAGPEEQKEGSNGAIIGVVCGVVIMAAVIGAAAYFFVFKPKGVSSSKFRSSPPKTP